MASQLEVSVVIPSYNRKESVLRTLASLRQQTLAPSRYEVIVVDDGSTYEPAEVTRHPFPFSLNYLRQTNQGATVARNHGVQASRGDVIVFIDDDVTVSEETLEALWALCTQEKKVLVMGTLISRSNSKPSPFTQMAIAAANEGYALNGHAGDRDVHCTLCNTQLLAVRRSHFFSLGMLQDPTGGWPNWDDVDFGYRAHRAGFRLVQSARAIGEHWDYSLADLETACRRWQRASRSAVKLFQAHPGLQPLIPMLSDKTPIDWGGDSPRLIARKVVRRVTASSPVLWSMEQGASVLEATYSSPVLLGPLYRWIQGSYMLRGYREGLQAQRREHK